MKKDFSAFAYIQEQSSFAEDYGGNFGYEVHDRGNRFFLTFNAILQSFGIRNRNRRKYMAENVMNCIQTDPYIQDQLRLNKWMGEMDHPTPSRVGEELTVNRICTPDMDRTTHYIRSNGFLQQAWNEYGNQDCGWKDCSWIQCTRHG